MPSSTIAAIDRALAAVVFDDPAALNDLEAIVHPAVRVEVRQGWRRRRRKAASVIRQSGWWGGLAARCNESGWWLRPADATSQASPARWTPPTPTGASAAQGDITERTAPAATHILRTDGVPMASVDDR
jgi:hypothetical protein